MNKIKLLFLFLLILPIIIILPLILFNIKKPLLIYPGKHFEAHCGSDEVLNGRTEILKYSLKQNDITLNYILKKGFQFPFANIYFQSPEDRGININKYNRLKLKLQAAGADVISIRLLHYIDNYSSRNKYESHIITSRDIRIDENYKEYIIDLDTFKIPFWIYYYNPDIYNYNENIRRKYNLVQIEIGNNVTQELNKIIEVKTGDISLIKNNSLLFLRLSIISGIYYFIIIVLLIIRKYLIHAKNKISYLQAHIKINNHADRETKKILEYIHNNYQDSHFNIIDLNRYTGISTRKISKILQNNFNVSFKQYINKIRMDEARRLILKSDSNITEIAFLVGYNNTTHFYRIFKQFFRLSPTDYLKKHRKN